MAEKDAAPPAIRVADLNGKPMSFAFELLEQAIQEGWSHLDVLNRGRPILHLGPASALPERWRLEEPRSVPHIDLRRGRESLTKLRAEGRAYLLTQRRGVSLALWPLEDDYARPPVVAAVDRVAYLERQVRRLTRRIDKVELILDLVRIVMEQRARFGRQEKSAVSPEPDDGEDVDG